MTHVTRRQATGLLIASASAVAFPHGVAAETPQTLAKKLGKALNGRVKGNCEGAFRVTKFELSGSRKNVVMRAVIQLDWPPGVRRRPFRSTGKNQQEAIVAMFQESLGAFHKNWPDCIRL